MSANIKAKGPLASQISGLYFSYKNLSVGGEVVGIVGYTSKETPFLSNPGIFYFYSTHCLKIDAPNQSSVLFLWTVGKSKNHTWYWANSVLRIMLLNQAGGFHIVLSYLLQTFALLLSELLC